MYNSWLFDKIVYDANVSLGCEIV